MKLVVDENIPQGKEAFSGFGEIIFSDGRAITNKMLKDVDILVSGSITQVNEDLLKDTKVKFVGTATIGTDHIDKAYLEKNGIRFADAAGCNAFSVAEYVVCAINQYLVEKNEKFNELSIGVIGYGNVGSKVVKFSEALGLNILINDPPLQRTTGRNIFCSLDEALSADIITFHVPLFNTGANKTFHLLNEKNLLQIKSGSLLINSSRGPVVDNEALLKRIDEKNDLFTVLDVWENEPNLIEQLLQKVNLGTPHIAGYSYEGKINGTTIIYNKLCDFLDVKNDWTPNYPSIEKNNFVFGDSVEFEVEFDKLTRKIYDINIDSTALKNSLSLNLESRPKYFDDLRKKYPVRREFNNYMIELLQNCKNRKNILENLRFNTVVK